MVEHEDMTIAVRPLDPLPNAHKYSRGKLVLCGGSRSYPGAIFLSAWASQYAGAGYTEVFTSEDHLALVQSFRPSLVVRPFDAFVPEKIASARHPRACVVGPGVDQEDQGARKVVISAIQSFEGPLLIDGGALTFVSEEYIRQLVVYRAKRGLPSVLTPHGGEASRLAAGYSFPEDDQEMFARNLASAYAALVVLKGADTVVSDGERVCRITQGTAALAKAGTGDVLAGIIGSELVQGYDPFTAAVFGVSLHADAGNLAAKRYGKVSVCAEEVVEALPCAIREAQENPRHIPIKTMS